MDSASQNVVRALTAFNDTVSQLRSFGYDLYLQTGAHSWTNPLGITLYGGGDGLTFGCSIWQDGTGNRWIGFEIHVTWDVDHWLVRAHVDDEDDSRDPTTVGLWQSPQLRAVTLDELIDCLQRTMNSAKSSVRDDRIATYLAKIERR